MQIKLCIWTQIEKGWDAVKSGQEGVNKIRKMGG